ncbi:DAK2 domain-containing protein, partial [Phytoactinopolyspora endophytica]|uniref:DAK2 domain-containing protein n=1 Tax=Phytoactinopolyspora endophytica TaxID=1642495 RepID=UPI00197C6CE3
MSRKGVRVQPVADAEIVRRWCRAGLDGLADTREEIDALNVYPVPDGDTGTNLYLTMEAACAAVDQECGQDADVGAVVEAMARGALLGARGNSGIILAQMLRGVAGVLARPGTTLADGRALALALENAAESAYGAVQEPVEGTILTVARAAAAGARAHGEREATDHDEQLTGLSGVALAAALAARRALAETPHQLDVLRRAGVVDAGGRGLVVLLDAFDTVLTGRRPLPAPRRVGEHHVPVPTAEHGQRPSWPPAAPDDDAAAGASAAEAEAPGGMRACVHDAAPSPADPGRRAPAYEVMYLLDAPDNEIPGLRDALAGLGDSLVVVGGDGEWNVHVHVDDAGAAIEAGVAVGRPYRISVTHLTSHGPPEPPGERL